MKKIILVCLIALSPLSLRAEKFKEMRSEHFMINYAEGTEDAVYKVKDDAEYYYRSITQEFGFVRDKLWSWDNRAKIIIAKDKDAYLEEFKCPSWSGACVDYYNKIIYTYPFQGGFSSVLLHELTHIIFREYIGYNKFPLWLDEGMAQYMEYRGSSQLTLIKSSIKKLIEEGKYIKFSQIGNIYSLSQKDDPRLFYSQAFSMVYFLKERFGNGNFAQFLSYLRSNNNIEEALRRAFRVLDNTERFEAEWKRFYSL
ncbi:MAG: hypothetical protein WC412_05920 [Candidatus Omnitrophota bacterium]|jgi:hypothetical protein